MGAVGVALLLSVVAAARCCNISCGSSVLDQVPLIVGNNWLARNIRDIDRNQINGFDFDSDLTRSSTWNCHMCSTDLPRLRRGKVGAVFFVAFANCIESQYKDAVEQTLEQIDVIRRLTAKYPNDLQLVDSAAGIEAAFVDRKIASLIGVQGGHLIGFRLAVLRSYYLLGARYLSLAYQCSTPWSGDDKSSRGLTNFGRDVVLEMNRLGMMVDLARCSHQTSLDAMTASLAPVIFSYSVAWTLCQDTINVRDDIIRRLKSNQGVFMVGFHSGFQKCLKTRITMDGIVAHINHVRNLAGVDHVGIGSGYDVWHELPVGLEDPSHFPALFDRLKNNRSGEPVWTEQDLRKLAGENLLRVFRKVEEVRDMIVDHPVVEKLLPTGKIPKKVRACNDDL